MKDSSIIGIQTERLPAVSLLLLFYAECVNPPAGSSNCISITRRTMRFLTARTFNYVARFLFSTRGQRSDGNPAADVLNVLSSIDTLRHLNKFRVPDRVRANAISSVAIESRQNKCVNNFWRVSITAD